MERATPCLWFDGNAEEPMTFYASIFRHAKIGERSCVAVKAEMPRS